MFQAVPKLHVCRSWPCFSRVHTDTQGRQAQCLKPGIWTHSVTEHALVSPVESVQWVFRLSGSHHSKAPFHSKTLWCFHVQRISIVNFSVLVQNTKRNGVWWIGWWNYGQGKPSLGLLHMSSPHPRLPRRRATWMDGLIWTFYLGSYFNDFSRVSNTF